jgi:hypothetical protein
MRIIILLAIITSLLASSCGNKAICTYEGLECPNAQKALETCIDVAEHNKEIEMHIVSITITDRGLINIVYDYGGDRYDWENIHPEKLKHEFGITLHSYPNNRAF